MKLVFTLNQMEAFALSESRFSEVYDLCRSYNGIPVGVHWSSYDFMDYFFDSGTFKVHEEGELFFSRSVCIRGQVFDLEVVRHACNVHHSMINLKLALRDVKNGQASVSTMRKLRSHLVTLLDEIEW